MLFSEKCCTADCQVLTNCEAFKVQMEEQSEGSYYTEEQLNMDDSPKLIFI